MFKKLYEHKMITAVMAILFFVAVFFMGHEDGRTITSWAIKLLNAISSSKILDYPNEVYCNYSMLLNGTIALWELPLYLIAKSGHDVSAISYYTWEKFLVLILQIISADVLARVAVRFGIDAENAFYVAVAYLMSPMVLLYGIANGQVDVFGILFVLLGVEKYLEKKYLYMMILFSLALVFKPYVLLIICPLFLLHFLDNIKKCLIYFIGMWIFPCLVHLATRTIWPTYYIWDVASKLELFYPNIFGYSINGVSAFTFCVVLVSCFMVYMGRSVSKNREAWLFAVNVLWIVFLVTTTWNPQYTVYMIPFMIVAVFLMKPNAFFEILYFSLLEVFSGYCFVKHNVAYNDSLRITLSLLGARLPGKERLFGPYVVEKWGGWIPQALLGVIIAIYVFLIYQFYCQRLCGKKCVAPDNQNDKDLDLQFLIFLPSITLMGLYLIFYIM